MIKAVLFDFIGTTVNEKNAEVINQCFEKAFIENNVPINRAELRKDRGKDKKIIIENILRAQHWSLSLIENIYSSFKKNLVDAINQFSENDGAHEIFRYLKERNIKIGIGTGLERDVFEMILTHLKWDRTHFDYIGVANEIGRSRPFPDMIFDMMNKSGILNSAEILKIGDTVADIQEGKNAKVQTAVILSGTQPNDVLLRENLTLF